MKGINILLASPCAEVKVFLREKLMGAQYASGPVHFAGITLDVLDIAEEQQYTRTFMAARNLQERGKYEAHVNALDLTTLVGMDCHFYALFHPHFLELVKMVALELSRHFGGYALVVQQSNDEESALFKDGTHLNVV